MTKTKETEQKTEEVKEKVTPIKSKQKEVSLQELKKEMITVKIKGITPLLMEKMDMSVVEKYDDRKAKKVSVKDEQSEEDKVEAKKYYTESGEIGFPAIAFLRGMTEVAPYLDGLDKKLVRGSIRMMDSMIPIKYKSESVDVCWGRTSGISKAPRKIMRPKFTDWSCELKIMYNASNISPEQIINLLNWAGFQMGLGGFRPEKSGNFGQYEVSK